MNHRVVVTGMGVISPLGLNAPTSWKQMITGQSGIDEITLFDTTDCPVKIAGEVKGFDPETTDLGKTIRKVGRFSLFAVSAAKEAFQQAGLFGNPHLYDAYRAGVNLGVGMGGLTEIENVHNDFLAKGYRRITPYFITQSIPNLAAGMVSLTLGLKGPNLCITTACASSSHSIGESMRSIRRGEVDVMLAGGSEAVVCKLGIGGFAVMRALSTRNDEPKRASRPYDVSRDGFVMGEGAAIFVLESEQHAKKRGAKIYGEILGYGLSADAYHLTSPGPEGEGGRRSMEMALKDAQLDASKIQYLNSHGTSTPIGDLEEARAIASVFGKNKNFHVSSTKSATGHLLGAAGALEAFFTIMAIQENKIPPTLNLEEIDPECEKLGLSFTPLKTLETQVDFAVSNSFGFGGTNASLVFGKYAP